jgi:hypothetical protein
VRSSREGDKIIVSEKWDVSKRRNVNEKWDENFQMRARLHQMLVQIETSRDKRE